MIKYCTQLIIIACTLTQWAIGQTNSQVSINVNIVPPYPTRITDLADRPGKVILTLRNLTVRPVTIYLRASLSNDNGINITSDPNYRPPSGITLQANQVLQADYETIRSLFDPNTFRYQGIQQKDIIRMKGLPEGNYEICVRAYDFQNNLAVSDASPAGCNSFRMVSLEPPMLIKPMEEENITVLQPQNIIFSWTLVPGAPPGTRYRLRLVEMLDPKRNINDAFQSSTSPAFFETTVQGNIYVYGPADPALVPGRKYAWAVAALDEFYTNGRVTDQGTAFRNNGRSEVRGFIAGNNNAGSTITTVGNAKPAAATGKVKFTPNTAYADLNRTSFKGRLMWAFRKTESGVPGSSINIASLQQTGPLQMNTNVPALLGTFEKAGATGIVTATSQTNAGNAPVSNAGANNLNIAGGGTVIGGFMAGGVSSLAALAGKPAEKDYQQELQKKINELADKQHYPLANTQVKLELFMDPKLVQQSRGYDLGLGNNKNKLPAYILLGKTKTDADGNFNIDYFGQIGIGYQLVLTIDNFYFEFADIGINIHTDENGTYDVGELLGLAKTYRLKVKVKDDAGNNLESAKVTILRQTGFYNKDAATQSLEKEVMRDVMKDEDKAEVESNFNNDRLPSGGLQLLSMLVAGKGKSGDQFSRMFINESYNDRYTVRISADDIPSKSYNLFVQGYTGGYVENGVPVIEKEYILPVPNPIVSGRVLVKNGDIPVKGAKVVVLPKLNAGESYTLDDLKKIRTAETDAEGKFKIENISPSTTPYVMQVNYKSKEYIQSSPLFLNKKGLTETRDPIFITAALTTVCGVVKDKEGMPVANASLQWKEGGDVFFTDEAGNFLSGQTEGKHTLLIKASGYKDVQQELDVKETGGSSNKTPLVIQTGNSNYAEVANTWTLNNFSATSIGNKSNAVYQLAGTGPKGSFENGITAQTATFQKIFGNGDIISVGVSCDHVITMSRFYVLATVKDAVTNNPIKGATVNVAFSEKIFTTDASGKTVVSDVPSGAPQLVVNGPAASMYEVAKTAITVNNTKDTIAVEVKLKAGSKLTGKVTAGGTPQKNAEVYVVGKEYITTKTDEAGNYTLNGVPVGEYTVRAAKEGLLAKDSANTFTANNTYTIDFILTDPGFNASSLYGFKLVLHKAVPAVGSNEFIISGELTDLPDNSVFRKLPGEPVKLPFTNLTIIKEGEGIRAKAGEVKTDVSEIPLKAFEFAIVKLKSSDGLRVKPIGADKTKGEVVGEVTVDLLSTFASLTGWKAPSAPISIRSGELATIGALTSNGAINASTIKLAGSADGLEVYGISLKPDWPNCSIAASGFSFKGALNIKNVPLISDVTLQLKELTIDKMGKVTKVDITVDPQPEVKLVSWTLKVTGVNLDQYGLKFSGNLDVPLPSSPVAKIGVNNLGLKTSGISGGDFYFPAAGIDVFGAVKFKAPAGSVFSLQKIPGSNHFQLIGSATISVPSLIKKELEMENFNIATNGNFGAVVKTGFTVGFADMANLTVSKVGFNTASKQIDIGGKFKLNIPGFGIGAGGTVHYAPSKVSVDDLDIGFSLASAIDLSAKVSFKGSNEFSGGGAIKIAGLSAGLGLDFHYKKLTGGINVGASFTTGIVLPIGLVKLDKLSGGFDLNTATSVYSVFAGGRITLAPDPAGIIALDPVKVTFTSTPAGIILLGQATVKAMDTWNIGKAEMKIDFPAKQFYIDGEFGGGFTLLKGVGISAKSGVHIEANTKSDAYWFMSTYTNTNIAHIFNASTTIAGGWNVPKTAHASLNGIPDYVLTNGRLYGAFIGTSSHVGGKSPEVDIIGLAAIQAWYNADGNVAVYSNFKTSSFGLKLSQSWNAGGNARIYKLGNIASADIKMNGDVNGAYSPSGWSIKGALSGSIYAHLGCDGGCGLSWGCCFNPCWPWKDCDICPCPCGVKVCASASVNVSYSSANGFSFNLSAF